MASVVRFRIKGRFASPTARGSIPYVGPRRLHGAARASTRKVAQTRVRRKRRKKVRRKKLLPRSAPSVTPSSFPDDFVSSFKSFLKFGRFVADNEEATWFALFRVSFKGYKEFPTRVLPVPLGTMTGKEARAFTEEEAFEQAALAEKSGKWFSQIEDFIGIYPLRSEPVRIRIAGKLLPGAKKSKKQKKRKRKRKPK